MELFGFDSIRNNISVEDFQISSLKVKVGDSLEFGFNLLNHSNKTIKIRLEYGIYYQKVNGTLTKKVHKISEKEYTGIYHTNNAKTLFPCGYDEKIPSRASSNRYNNQWE